MTRPRLERFGLGSWPGSVRRCRYEGVGGELVSWKEEASPLSQRGVYYVGITIQFLATGRMTRQRGQCGEDPGSPAASLSAVRPVRVPCPLRLPPASLHWRRRTIETHHTARSLQPSPLPTHAHTPARPRARSMPVLAKCPSIAWGRCR